MSAIKKNKKLKYTLLLTTLPQRYGHIKDVPEMEFSENYSVIRFYTPEHDNKFFKQIIAYIYFMIGALKYAYFNRKYFDSIFATSSRLGTGLLGFLISKITRKTLFLDIRDIFSDNLQSLPSFQNPLGKFIVKIFAKTESRIINHAKWVNFVSPGFKLYPHIAKMTRKFYLFTNGIDDIFLNDSAKRVFQKRRVLKDLKFFMLAM